MTHPEMTLLVFKNLSHGFHEFAQIFKIRDDPCNPWLDYLIVFGLFSGEALLFLLTKWHNSYKSIFPIH